MGVVLNWLTRIEKLVAGLGVGTLTVLILMDIFSRELVKTSLPWAQKSAVYLMIWVGFLGAALISDSAGHLRPEIADKLWGDHRAKIFIRVQNFFTCIFCFILCYYSFVYVMETYEFQDRNVVLDIATWVLQVVMPYTFLSMGLRHLQFVFNPQLAIERKKDLH